MVHVFAVKPVYYRETENNYLVVLKRWTKVLGFQKKSCTQAWDENSQSLSDVLPRVASVNLFYFLSF